MKNLLLTLLSLFAMYSSALAYTVSGYQYLTNGSQSDVQAACSAAPAGSTVAIPAGTFTWSAGVNITNSIILEGVSTAAPVSLGQGPGTSSTFIVRANSYKNPLVSISPASDIPIRVTGINFNNGAGRKVSGANLTAVYIMASDTNPVRQIRIDNCTFNTGTQVVWWNGGAYGVVDHCYFANCWIGIMVNGGGNSDLGDLAWARNDYQAGSLNFPFTEDSIFVWNISGQPGSPWVTYHQWGGHSVLRHCTIDSTSARSITGPVDCHGNNTYWKVPGSNNQRGTTRFEFYNNTVKLGPGSYQVMDLRGGSAIVHDNVITTTDGDTPNIVDFRDEEDDPGNTGGIPVRSPVQWPCEEQITATFIWNNTVNGKPATVGVGTFGNSSANGDPFYIKANRDYWLSAPSSSTTTTYPLPPNGPTIAQYPSPYASLQTIGYTPAPYPHPLTGAQSSPTPTPIPE